MDLTLIQDRKTAHLHEAFAQVDETSLVHVEFDGVKVALKMTKLVGQFDDVKLFILKIVCWCAKICLLLEYLHQVRINCESSLDDCQGLL